MSLLKRFGRRLAAFSAIAATACSAPAAELREASPELEEAGVPTYELMPPVFIM